MAVLENVGLYLADTEVGRSWVTRKLGDSGSFLPRKSPQEPTLRTQFYSCIFRPRLKKKVEPVLEGMVWCGVGWWGRKRQKSLAWGLAKYLKVMYQLLGSDFDDDVILRKSPL